jgi:hypothetical protein
MVKEGGEIDQAALASGGLVRWSLRATFDGFGDDVSVAVGRCCCVIVGQKWLVLVSGGVCVRGGAVFCFIGCLGRIRIGVGWCFE